MLLLSKKEIKKISFILNALFTYKKVTIPKNITKKN